MDEALRGGLEMSIGVKHFLSVWHQQVPLRDVQVCRFSPDSRATARKVNTQGRLLDLWHGDT
jgi:hypothetical protein